MECPACRQRQPAQEPGEPLPRDCAYCGVVFEKWFARLKQQEEKKTVQPPTPVSPQIYIPSGERSLLDTSSSDVMAFKVDPHLRTIFAVVLVTVEPAMRYAHHLALPWIKFSHFYWVAAACTGFGIYIGMAARKRGYSEILTPGGAGIFSGLFVASVIILIFPGPLMMKLSQALPAFGIYGTCSVLGGVIAYLLRTILEIELK